MYDVKLSSRLQTIAKKVPNGAVLADIGSDHAYLPVYLAQKGKIARAVAGELNDGPYQSARTNVESSQFTNVIDVRQGDGLEVIQPGEVDTVVIAGMGGSLICSILDRGNEKLSSVRRLILQPNVSEKAVRTWLIEHQWALQEEILLKEDGIFYEVLVADRIEEANRYNEALYQQYTDDCGNEITKYIQLEMGPFLLRQKEPHLLYKWQNELRKLDRIIENMKHSEAEEAILKRNQMETFRKNIEEVLQCLQKDKPSFK